MSFVLSMRFSSFSFAFSIFIQYEALHHHRPYFVLPVDFNGQNSWWGIEIRNTFYLYYKLEFYLDNQSWNVSDFDLILKSYKSSIGPSKNDGTKVGAALHYGALLAFHFNVDWCNLVFRISIELICKYFRDSSFSCSW